MRIVVAGGTGQIGLLLVRSLRDAGHRVQVLTRRPTSPDELRWDGASIGSWADALDGCDGVINLAGRSVNCRYTKHHLAEMRYSRLDSTRAIGAAIEACRDPPRVWLQASTATIYSHRYDAPHDEETGVIGGSEPDVPGYWRLSVDIATSWEQGLMSANTPRTRRVAMRTAFTMNPDRGSVFDWFVWLARTGFGGPMAGGRQMVSWIHGDDLVRAVQLALQHPTLQGPVNFAAPRPLPVRDFMRILRTALGVRVGLPLSARMVEMGAAIVGTDPELVLKSRYVVPGRLLASGFTFRFPTWEEAAPDLVSRLR